MLAGSEERAGLDLAPIGCPKTTSGVPIQDSTRDIRHVCFRSSPGSPPSPRPTSRSHLSPHTSRHQAKRLLSPLSRHSDIPNTNHSRRTDINHELLHPSRILDARANWCVYKSISQLPLDCYLRQPASDRGKCLRGHIIHQTTSERVEHAPA
jgi:hypothetical protein